MNARGVNGPDTVPADRLVANVLAALAREHAQIGPALTQKVAADIDDAARRYWLRRPSPQRRDLAPGLR